MMVKTKFDRIEAGDPGVAVFRVAGKLGFHENEKIERLADECLKRSFRIIVFDFTDLVSLGGGVAKILRDFVAACARKGEAVRFVVTNDIVAQFLREGDAAIQIHRTLQEALAAGEGQGQAARSAAPAPEASEATARDPGRSGSAQSAASPEVGAKVIFMSYDSAESERVVAPETAAAAPATESAAHADPAAKAEREAGRASARIETPPIQPRPARDAEEIISQIFGSAGTQAPPDWIDKPTSPFDEKPPAPEVNATVVELNRQLKRRILELKTLFSISADFNAIWERRKLVDIFLLTSIAQGGVESAAFLENLGNGFKPLLVKGLGSDAVAKLTLAADAVSIGGVQSSILPVDSFPLADAARATVKEQGIEFICPFRQKDGLAGLVLLGKRIAGRGMKDEDFEFLRTLISIAQGAYENTVMFEREHERTLGIVKTLISIIEENTLLKGTSEFVSRYVGMVAKNMDYPEERFKDLIYGAVLRDMGMVKVSDLILRSPRDLTKEEWEIIKRHPEDGAEMLSRMKFGEHVVNVVRTHHERFNGEGYPFGLRGKEIPLGARIISVVESYAAMIHERPNRPALSEREALDTLKENFGLRYDREVVMHFAKIMEKEIAQTAGYGVPSSERGR
jgi:HD-GYP domain-containing protein (c-di-GMP phosphodiesterase class II)